MPSKAKPNAEPSSQRIENVKAKRVSHALATARTISTPLVAGTAKRVLKDMPTPTEAPAPQEAKQTEMTPKQRKAAIIEVLTNPVRQPIVGEQARRVAHALRTGGYITSPAAEATFQRILERRARDKAKKDAAEGKV